MSMILFHRVMSTPIKPAGAKLVASVLAVWALDDGVVTKRHSFGFIGKCCDLSPDQAARHIKALISAGLLTVLKAPTQRDGAQYAIQIGALMPLADHFKHLDRGGIHAPSEGASTPPEGGHPRPLRGGVDAPQPQPTKNGNVFGGGGVAPTGSVAAPPPLGSPRNLPGGLRQELFDGLVANGPTSQSRIDALVKTAGELAAQGHDINVMAQMAVESGWKRWGRPPDPSAPTKANGRTTARKTASVVPSVDNTRTPGRYDSMKARAYHAN